MVQAKQDHPDLYPTRQTNAKCLCRKMQRKYQKRIIEYLGIYLSSEVREKTEEWMIDYNNERPHKALGYIPPKVYAEKNYKSSLHATQLYPQMANEKPLQGVSFLSSCAATNMTYGRGIKGQCSI